VAASALLSVTMLPPTAVVRALLCVSGSVRSRTSVVQRRDWPALPAFADAPAAAATTRHAAAAATLKPAAPHHNAPAGRAV
jgi:hypothetical protein